MKINGRTLKRRLFGLTTLPERVARVRFFRGHGVHSPFVYNIVRQVFMRSSLMEGETTLFEALLAQSVAKRPAMQLQNLYTHCGYRTFALDSLTTPCDLCIATEQHNEQATVDLARRAASQGTTLVLMEPYNGRERADLCRRLVEEHPCTSVDKGSYLLLFTHPNLPKQAYRL